MEDAVVPQLLEIRDTDEMARYADFRVGHREQYAFDKRIGDKQPEQYDRRQQQHGSEPAFVFESPGEWAAPRQGGIACRTRRLVNCCHRAFLPAGRTLAVNLYELVMRPFDRVLGRHALDRLRVHIDDNVFRDRLGCIASGWPGIAGKAAAARGEAVGAHYRVFLPDLGLLPFGRRADREALL